MREPVTSAEPAAAPAGRRVEQARYRIEEGTRAVIAQRVGGRVALVDVPVDFPGRVYLVERHLDSLAELEGLVAAYIAHSADAGCPAVIAHRRHDDDLVDAVA